MKRQAFPTRDRLAALIRGFGGCRVAVVGDLVADEFVHGEIMRVSREAPVLILEHRETIAVPGGGGNAVANLRALGATPVPVGVVGRDEAGKQLLAHFRRAKIPVAGIRIERAYETPTKSRIVAGGIHTRRQQVVRIDRGQSHGELPREAFVRLRLRLRAAARASHGVLVADYGYGAAPPEVLSGLPRAGLRAITVDSRARIGRFTRIAACTPNQEEVERELGAAPLAGEAELARAGRTLLRRTGNGAVLITRGAKGMCLVQPGEAPAWLPAFGGDEVADVTGAGDTVIATFTLALLSGASFLEAAVLSNVAAGLVVMKAGTATVSPREMRDALAELSTP